MGDKDENENDLSQSTDPGIRATQISSTGLGIALIAYNIPNDGPYSPLSISSILANLKAGVGVDLKDNFALLTYISDLEFFKGFSTILKSIHSKSNESNFTLKIENRVFARNSLKLEKEFVDLLRENFSTEVTSIDFKKSKKFIKAVNTWATVSTNNLMGNILPPGIEIEDDLDLVWFSMVYFKGFWAQKFNPDESFNGPFFTDKNEIVQVRYMHMTNHRFLVGSREFRNMKIDIISIPFQGNRLRLVVYLPTVGSELSDVIMENRDPSIFIPEQLGNILEEKSVNLRFPKFRQELYWPPFLPLLLMGMPIDQELDWSPIGHHEDGQGINSLNALEKIVVEFDEGIGGSGGFVYDWEKTGIFKSYLNNLHISFNLANRFDSRKSKQLYILNIDESSTEILEFNVNRPFFYAIWDTFTNMFIIQGHCTNPAEKNSDDFSPKKRGPRTAGSSNLCGIKNLGNTCFMNSVLQCLANTALLLDYFQTNEEYLAKKNYDHSPMKGALVKAFLKLLYDYWSDGEGYVDPTSFKQKIQKFDPRFKGTNQHDAQEFLRWLLEGLHKELNITTDLKKVPIDIDTNESLSDEEKARKFWNHYQQSDDSVMVDLFVGQFKSTVECTFCGHRSVTFEIFWDLSLPIPTESSVLELTGCLDQFTNKEILDEKRDCSLCNMRQDHVKSLLIQKTPKILVIHLKKFSSNQFYKGNLSTVINFPLDLELGPYTTNPGQGVSYNLYGVINHSGSDNFGHYIALCKHPHSGEWHRFNDSRVSAISTSNLVANEAYILFYELAGQKSDS